MSEIGTVLEDVKDVLSKIINGIHSSEVGGLLLKVENLGKDEADKTQAPVAAETDAEKIARLEAELAAKDTPAAGSVPVVELDESVPVSAPTSPYGSLA